MAGKGKTTKGKPGAKAKSTKAKSTPKGKPAKPEPAKRSATKKGGAAKKTTALAIPTGDPLAAAEKFERDLLIRGEAMHRKEGGRLPLDATHEIVEGDEGEHPKIERRRFKLW